MRPLALRLAGRLATAARPLCSGSALHPLLPPAASSRPLLCLDLEETLVHCETDDKDVTAYREDNGPEQMRANAAARAHDKAFAIPAPDAELDLPYLEAPVRLYKRPLLDDFLEEASKLCDLVVFTSAAESYARAIAASIDPDRRCAALLTREDCTPANGMYAKDLGRLGRPLERVVLLDDNAGSFMNHLDNGVPISAFFGDPADRGLSSVLPLLRALADADDVRPVIRDRFKMRESLLRDLRFVREAVADRG